jgi:hypothetical protein
VPVSVAYFLELKNFLSFYLRVLLELSSNRFERKHRAFTREYSVRWLIIHVSSVFLSVDATETSPTAVTEGDFAVQLWHDGQFAWKSMAALSITSQWKSWNTSGFHGHIPAAADVEKMFLFVICSIR